MTSDKLKVAIVGIGAIGGHAAVRLARGGTEVSALARGATLAALQSGPLTLVAEDGSYDPMTAPIRAAASGAELGRQDVVVVAVKHSALHSVLPAVRDMMDDGTLVVFAMNGLPVWFGDTMPGELGAHLASYLDPEGIMRAVIPPNRWVGCAVTSGNRVVAPGRVLNTTPTLNRLVLGLSDGSVPRRLEQFVAAARAGGYTADAVDDVRRHVWSKLLVNGALSSISTIVERNIRDTFADPDCREIGIGVIGELLGIGRNIGILVEADAEAMTDPAKLPRHVTSFLQDLLNSRPLEIRTGLLAAREIARLTGQESPYLSAVSALLNARSPVPGESYETRRTSLLDEMPVQQNRTLARV